VFEGFAGIGSATRLLPILRAEGLLTKHGRPFDKGAVYKLLVNRVYLGEAVHKGKSYPGEHAAIISQALWNRVHEIMASNPHMRAGLARNRSPALLRGLIFGADGRALSPTHTRKQGRLYRYYVSQSVLKGGADDAPYRRLPAGEIEALAPDLAEDTVQDALAHFDPVWSELFPAEQERLIRLLVQRVVVGEAGAQISLNLEGLASLARDLSQPKRIAA
jgi:hypothetical protein